jgi:hypothetical protein
MTTRIVSVTSLLCALAAPLVAGCSGAPAGAAPAAAPGGRTPAAPAEARRLSGLLLGQWKGSGTITMEGKTSPIELELSCTEASAGWGVSCRAAGVDPAGVRHEETHLWGYSADGAKVHFFAVTTDGDTHDHAGTFTEHGVELQYRGSMGGSPFVESIRLDSAGASSIRFHNDTKVGDASVLAMDVTLRK